MAAAYVLTAVKPLPLALVLADLEIRADRLRTIGDPPVPQSSDARHAVAALAPDVEPGHAASALRAFAEEASSPDGALLVFLAGVRGAREIAALRNALWPFAHVVALYHLSNRQILRANVEGTHKLAGGCGLRGVLLVARRRASLFAPEATVAKFDRNAPGWNGLPGTPGYAHFRWMRRFVAEFARVRGAPNRILDFGCGAGWVGIEAALRHPGSDLAAFDPSAEMVKLAAENARAAGIARFEGRTGFGEDPPFPSGSETPFDLVLSSGVLSFSGEPERWLDGLVRTLAKGATLVIGDINRESKGMRRRRAEKPLLPVRELNAWTRDEVRTALESRDLAFEAWTGYQRTWPIPQAMHYDATRLRGAFRRPLLWINQASSALDARGGSRHPERFDSWVLRMRRA